MANARRRGTGGNEQSVPATEIVRHFSVWQDRSSERPVTILHHGRPRSVLLSLERYGELLAGQGSQDEREARLQGQLDVVLAHMASLFIQLDRNLRVTRINRAASALLGRSPAELDGQPIEALFPGDKTGHVEKAGRKVLKSGLSEQLHISLNEAEDRRHLLDITPFPNGAAIFCTDVTPETGLENLRELQAAEERLLSMMTGCAIGQAGPDGALVGVHPTLKRLLRFPVDDIATTSFFDLFEEPSRRKIRLHLDHVFGGKGPVCCRADILTRDRGAVSIRLFLAPRMNGDAVESVLFSILDDSLGALPMR